MAIAAATTTSPRSTHLRRRRSPPQPGRIWTATRRKGSALRRVATPLGLDWRPQRSTLPPRGGAVWSAAGVLGERVERFFGRPSSVPRQAVGAGRQPAVVAGALLVAELAHDRPRPVANPAAAVDARPRPAVRTAMTRTGEHLGGEPGRLVLDGFPDLIVRIHIVPRAPRPPAAIVLSHAVPPLLGRSSNLSTITP